MKYIALVPLLFCSCVFVSAQKHDYNWVMGYDYDYLDPFGNMRLDFNHTPPKIVKENLKMNFTFCSGTFSDSSGNLLFYTNGIRIFNKNHLLMEGGDTINPGKSWELGQEYGYSAFYSPFALPLPNAAGIYYLFHADVALLPGSAYINNLYYTIIDMNANGGLGKVIKKNQALLTGDLIWPAGVKHGNGRDWWIVTAQKGDVEHAMFLLSPEGVTGPYYQEIGPPFLPIEFVGESLFSESGNIYLRHDSKTALRIYDFDRCSGQLSNLRIIPFQGQLNSFFAAFSPDDRFLYFSRPGWVWSIDLLADDISGSYDSVAAWEINAYPTFPWYTAYGLNQLAPDGKIYWGNYTSTQALNVMHRPNLPGDAADCEEEAVLLPRINDLTITQFPNYRLGKWESSPCDTLHFMGTSDGFVATPYTPAAFRRDSGYTLLPPIGGGACPDCTPRDLELLNNPMAAVHARLHLQLTGKLPDDWPREKAERSGLIIASPNHEHVTTRKKDE